MQKTINKTPVICKQKRKVIMNHSQHKSEYVPMIFLHSQNKFHVRSASFYTVLTVYGSTCTMCVVKDVSKIFQVFLVSSDSIAKLLDPSPKLMEKKEKVLCNCSIHESLFASDIGGNDRIKPAARIIVLGLVFLSSHVWVAEDSCPNILQTHNGM